jgi:16S rRNA (guanine966-N2)-methyltransferase
MANTLRIIAGHYARRNLQVPSGKTTRPTSARLREAIFNVLAHQSWLPHDIFETTKVLDVFCGTGALGLEAISRGAAKAWLIESDPAAQAASKANISALNLSDRVKLIPSDALAIPQASEACDLVFLDPPYRQQWAERIVPLLITRGWIKTMSLIVLETAADEAPNLPSCCQLLQRRTYGIAAVSFYKKLE